MKHDNKEHVKTWIRDINHRNGHGLTDREIEKAATIGEAAWKGNVGVGDAARTGIDAVKKLRE